MTWFVGWHIAFLAPFAVEARPFGDLAPSWTLAVLSDTRSKRLEQTDLPAFPTTSRMLRATNDPGCIERSVWVCHV
jgi:hypothetical protein